MNQWKAGQRKAVKDCQVNPMEQAIRKEDKGKSEQLMPSRQMADTRWTLSGGQHL